MTKAQAQKTWLNSSDSSVDTKFLLSVSTVNIKMPKN